MSAPLPRSASFRPLRPGLLLVLAGLGACSGGSSTPASSTVVDRGPKEPTALVRGADTPTIALSITGVSGASGVDGSFRAGDRLAVTFVMRKRNGGYWRSDDFALGRVLMSGPTSNYQRVLPEQADLLSTAVSNADGSYTYTFANPIPATYAAPLNDSPSFGGADGEMAGQELLAGTYTVGMYVSWNYTVDGVAFRESGNATFDFRVGGAPDLLPREVVRQDNCNQCHSSLRAHGGIRRDVRLCVLCHTSGAEDKNVATVEGGTPGASIDFRVMIHKIHNGMHLPSVAGVAVKEDGTRIYDAPKKPYKLVGFNDTVADFSDVAFPAWPDALIPMPRNLGYTQLSAANKATEDTLRTGVVKCASCHGDPDGAGPLGAPAQGQVAFAQASRRSCGSCHDDVDWNRPYTKNGATMPLQENDASCMLCHGPTDQLGIEKTHTHPLRDAAVNAGLVAKITALREAGTNDGDGTIDPGEKVAFALDVRDDLGAPVAGASLSTISAVVAGPTTNSNLLLNVTIPPAALKGTSPFSLMLPQIVFLEHVGKATSTLGETFTTALAPHWDPVGAATTVYVQTAVSGGASIVIGATQPHANFVDLVDGTGFARNDWVVIDPDVAGKTEYLQVQWVQGNRLWFGSTASTGYAPGTTKAHAFGATVKRVVLTAKRKGTDFTLDATTGRITEVTEFGDGLPVVVTYTTDYVVPATYPLALNDSPTLDETSGKWKGKPLADGTYTATVWAARNLTVNAHGESNAYRAVSVASAFDFLVGSAKTIEPYPFLDDERGCVSCHQDLSFHGGGRRGFAACIACHGTSGAEDRPRYVAPNAPTTPGTAISFRSMLHKIHAGNLLAAGASYQVVGFGAGAWPNNFGVTTFDEVHFPALPGGVLNCTKCHGATNTAHLEPAARTHPSAFVLPVHAWGASCGSCHDSEAAQAHIAVQTSPVTGESCTLCHGAGRDWDVRLLHKAR